MKLYVSPRLCGPAPLPVCEEDAGSRRARRIAAFNAAYRHGINELTACSPALEDLADAYPALLFALATGYGEPRTRVRAVEMILQGAPLREVAGALCLPWWLRKLPANAFQTPLPDLPRDNDYTVRMASLVPTDAASAPQWLRLVSEAHVAGGRDFSLWMARHGIALSGAMPEQRLALLMAWAWAGSAVDGLANSVVRLPWCPDMGIKRVLEEFTVWTQRIALLEWLASGRLTPWVPDGVHLGYMFTTLRTVADFIGAAEALDNCLEQYADRLRSEACAVASITKGGRIVACVEIAPHANDPAMPAIVQLRGNRNRRASIDVWQAAYAWLGAHPLQGATAERLVPPAADRDETRRQLWSPYLRHIVGAGGGAGMQNRARQLLLARHKSNATNPIPRPAGTAAGDFIHRPRGGALLGISDAVIQRLIELFPGSDARRG